MAGDNAAVTDENDNSKGAQDAASPTPMPPMAEKPGKKAPKGKEKEKKEKVKKVKKEKQAKPHPSSKAGPNFSIKITDDAKVEVMGVNKRAHALGSIADGDIITAIDGKDLTELPANIKVNDIRNLLLGPCGTKVSLSLSRGDQPLHYDLHLDFLPLVKSIKGGKPIAKGESAKISLKLVDTDARRELFYLAGALQPLCKLLIDPKAAAQMEKATASLQNMLKFSLWEDIHVPLAAIGKPLVQMIEKGGLAKKMLAMDLMLRIALAKSTHRVLVSGGLVESCCALPKGIIPLCLPKWTPKGWKPGKKVTGLETKAAKLLGCLGRVDDETRERINNGTNNGITLLVRMMQGKREPAGTLNEVSLVGQAVACEALQYLALNPSCRSALESIQAFDTFCDLLALPEGAHEKVDTTDIEEGFTKYDSTKNGSLGLKEFEAWYVESGRGDGRQAKAMFREVDYDNGGNISLAEMVEFISRKTPAQMVDIYAACTLRNIAVTEVNRERLLEKGALNGLAKMLAMHDDEERQRAAVLALVNFSYNIKCQDRMADLGCVDDLVQLLRRHDGKGEVACAAAMCLRQMCLIQRCQEAVKDKGGIELLCGMLKSKDRPDGCDPVGNPINCNTSAAAIAALQNAVSNNEEACVKAIEGGVIGTIVRLLEDWIETATSGEGEADSDESGKEGKGEEGATEGAEGQGGGGVNAELDASVERGGAEWEGAEVSSPEQKAHEMFEGALHRGTWVQMQDIPVYKEAEEDEEEQEAQAQDDRANDNADVDQAVPSAMVVPLTRDGAQSAMSRISFKSVKTAVSAISASKFMGILPGKTLAAKAFSSANSDSRNGASDVSFHLRSESKASTGSRREDPRALVTTPVFKPAEEMVGEIRDDEGRLTWMEEWWVEQEASVAERGAWLLHSLSFKNKEMLIAAGARDVLQRVTFLSAGDEDYKGTNTAATWAHLALKQ